MSTTMTAHERADEQLRRAARTWVEDGRPGPERWARLPRPSREAMRTLGMSPRRAFVTDEIPGPLTKYVTLGEVVSLLVQAMTAVILLWLIMGGADWQTVALAGLSGFGVVLLVRLADQRIEARSAARRERARPWIEDAVERFGRGHLEPSTAEDTVG